MEYITLNNGVKMPVVGFGVYQISKTDCEQAVVDAIEVGYRLIDTAQSYFNEAEVGQAIYSCGLAREELFITTKVWIDNYGYEKTLKSIDESMRKLKVDYIDLVLLHQPFSDYYGAYRALEYLYKQGVLRAIGVSNFYPDRLSDICAFNEIIPQVNQVETNPFNQQRVAQENMKKNKVQIEAWAPFGEGRNNLFQNTTLSSVAVRYNKTVPQVVLRWLVQREVVVLAKSISKARMKENIEIFDFSLSAEDMNVIATLDKEESLFFNHQSADTVDFFVNLIKARKNL